MSAPIVTQPSTSVSDAISTRRSVRAFESRPVAESDVCEILAAAGRAASGGNLQPWKIHVLAGDERQALVDRVAEKMKSTPFGDGPEYDIYPADLTAPYSKRRSAVARGMYELIGIARDDSEARTKQMALNFAFFGAPVGMIVSIDRQMGPPQFCDLGLFLGNLMLAAREKGLHTCPQEAWSLWGKTIREVVGIPNGDLVFCGVALGYADGDAAINRLVTERQDVNEFAVLRGF